MMGGCPHLIVLPVILYILLVGITISSGIVDYREHRIPNWITVPGLLLGLGANTVLADRTGWRFALMGMLAAIAVYLPLYLVRAMGAGDVKLMAALGAIVGPLNWGVLFISTAIIGGVAALALVVRRRRFYETWFNLQLLVFLSTPFSPALQKQLGTRRAKHTGSPHAARDFYCGRRVGAHCGFLFCGNVMRTKFLRA